MLHFNLTLVNVRLKQIERESGGLGPLYLILLAAALLVGEYYLYQLFLDIESCLYYIAVLFLALLSVHLSRSDSRFVWHRLQDPQGSLFGEYWIFSLPFTIAAIFTWQFWVLAIHFLVCWALSNWKYRRSEARIYWPQLSKIIPVRYFEWLSGIRKIWLSFSVLYLFICAFCWVQALPIVGLWFLVLMMSTFYQEGEPRNILQMTMEKGPVVFLRRKIFNHLVLALILFVPPLLLNALFHPAIWYFHLIFLCMYLLALAFLICTKYSQYRPSEQLGNSSVWQTMGLMGTAIPFLAPLPIFMTVRNYFLAISNLKKYNSERESD